MAHSYPIWNDVEACIYKTSKSFGARNTSTTKVYVGTSKSNSELLVEHVTTKRIVGDFTIFRFGVDTGSGLEVLKTMYMHTKTKVWFPDKPKTLLAA